MSTIEMRPKMGGLAQTGAGSRVAGEAEEEWSDRESEWSFSVNDTFVGEIQPEVEDDEDDWAEDHGTRAGEVTDDLAAMDFGVEFQGHPMLKHRECQLVKDLLDPAKHNLQRRQFKTPRSI